MKRLLIVDDEPAIVDNIAEVFRLKGFVVESAGRAEEVLPRVESFKPDVVFLDMDLQGDGRDRSGSELLVRLRARWTQKELPVIVISGVGDTRLLKELLHKGADDYEVKPIEFPGLLQKVERFLNRRQAGEAGAPAAWAEELVGRSKLLMNLTLNIWRAAQAESDTLILGETGTGKDLVAHTYHQSSPRSAKPLYEIDCANIPANLFETEIFGYVPGAYTDAKRGKKGRIEEAAGGIAFFNEIGDLPPEQQGKLLGLLETKTIVRVGSNQPLRLDVVILAATHRDLYSMVAQGSFRKDLYYRLYNQVIVNPPLRDHPEDIPLLVEHFLRKYNLEFGKSIQRCDPALLARLQTLPWPGNVRELMKCVRAGVQNCLDDYLTGKDIEDYLTQPKAALAAPSLPGPKEQDYAQDYAGFKAALDGMAENRHRDYLLHHLRQHGWNVARTAAEIHLKREYLNQLLKRYGIRREKGQ